MKRIYSIAFLLFQLAAIVYYGYLRVHNAAYVKEPRNFGDMGDYFHDAGLPVFSREFWTDARLPMTALFWKIVDSDPARIFQLQLYFSILCWVVLAYFSGLAVKPPILKPFLFLHVLGFSLSRDVFM